MRDRRGGTGLRAADFQRHDGFAGCVRGQGEATEAGAVLQAVDQQRHDAGRGMSDGIFHVVEDRHVGLVPGRGEQRQTGPQHGQPPGHGVEQGAGVGEDGDAAGLLALGVGGVEADRDRMMRVVDAVAVGADDADAFLFGDALQLALAFLATGIEAFGIAGGPDDDGFQPGAGAIADRLNGGLGGDREEGGVDRFGN